MKDVLQETIRNPGDGGGGVEGADKIAIFTPFNKEGSTSLLPEFFPYQPSETLKEYEMKTLKI
jgi:hypothetical protein